jgi:hypothetical protein
MNAEKSARIRGICWRLFFPPIAQMSAEKSMKIRYQLVNRIPNSEPDIEVIKMQVGHLKSKQRKF